jgi:hypothetical protein
MRIALGKFGWTPKEFWSATPVEWWSAHEGFFGIPEEDEEPMDRQLLEEMIEMDRQNEERKKAPSGDP